MNAPAGGGLLRPYAPGVLMYAVMMIVGGWVHPLLMVHLHLTVDGSRPVRVV